MFKKILRFFNLYQLMSVSEPLPVYFILFIYLKIVI